MRTLTRSAAIAVVALAVSGGAVAHAATPEVDLTVTPSSVDPGETITISGTGWTCVNGTGVVIDTTSPPSLDPVADLGFIDAENGAFETTTQAPDVPGTYIVTAFEEECGGLATATFVVVAPTTTTTTTTTVAPTTTTTVAPTTTAITTTSLGGAPVTVLPETGNTDGRIAVFAVLALLLGAGFVALARRPRPS